MKNNDEERDIDTDNIPSDFSYLTAIVNDIQTPANNLYGFLTILEENIDDPRLKHYINNAKESASFINELTTSVLDRAFNDMESKNSKYEMVNSAKYFSKISEIFVANMYKKSISFNVFIDPLLPKEIEINSLKLKRTIINLIDNAYKFTAKNGCIEFSVRYKAKDNKLHIFVKDNGIGIEKNKQKEIIKAFKQVEDNTNAIYGGHGLGLAICSCYINEFNGQLKIDSELGKGSTFYFDLPIQKNSSESTFKPLDNKNIHICILMDKHNSCSANNIGRQLMSMGVKKGQIKAIESISNIEKETTHIISYQSKISLEVVLFCGKNRIENLIIEEKLFSISRNQETCINLIISQYGYFTDTLYSFISQSKTPRILIVDENRINIALLKGILSEELCIIETANTAQKAIDMINQAILKDKAYTLIYMDDLESVISSDEVLNILRRLESKNSLDRTLVVSTSSDEEIHNSSYDFHVNKPFKKDEIVTILLNLEN